MFQKLIQFLSDRIADPKPVTVEVKGEPFAVRADGTLGEVVRKPAPLVKPALIVGTLTGFVDAMKASIDDFKDAAVQVVDHNTVELVSLKADEFGRRHVWLRAVNEEPAPFRFDFYHVPEQFLIDLQNGFLPTDNVVALQQVVSRLSSESSIATNDDGFSQTVSVQQGGVTRASVPLPSRMELLAYRTFREVDPVASLFMLRLQGKQGELPKAALVQLEAGKWKYSSIQQIKRYLEGMLPDKAIVIA